MEEPEIERGLARAAELFDAAEYHAAHEILDELWEQASPQDADFFKGLIQACIALHHHQQGNPDGARKLYSGHRRYLGRFLPAHRGLDLVAFLAGMQAALGPLLRAPPGAEPPFEPGRRPRMSRAPGA
jgi:predicted metal-dependent hydrolase